jgi:hypothetical protein
VFCGTGDPPPPPDHVTSRDRDFIGKEQVEACEIESLPV